MEAFRGKSEAGAYGDFMMETDHHVGRVLAFLEENGLAENTLVIVTSDNGPENTWPERDRRFGHRSNGIYRDGKRSVYEGGHRVPFLLRWPAGIAEPGRRWDGPVCQTDVLATLADLFGVELPPDAGEDSVSFLNVLLDAGAGEERSPLIHHGSNGRFAIREGAWKLVMEEKEAGRELYDLAADPSETRNVIADHPEIADQLVASLTEIVVSGRSNPGPKVGNDTGWWPKLVWIDPESMAATEE